MSGESDSKKVGGYPSLPMALRELLRELGKPHPWKVAWSWLCGAFLPALQHGVRFVFENFYNVVVKLPWAVAIVVIAAILIRGLTQHVTVVEPISVPKVLSESGYTPEVAGRRLRDAMTNFAANVNTRMKHPDVALHGELPNIVVPTVGISLDAIVSSIRTLLRSTRSRSIAGEFTITRNQLWLRLRIDGREFYSSSTGGDPEKPDELLKIASPEVLKIIQPYFVAASISDSDPVGALEMVNDIIARRQEWDENVAWSYNLKSSILWRRKEYAAAAEAAEKALQLDKQLVAAHINLGNILKDQGNREKALDKYRHAIKLDSKYALARYNLGVALREQGKTEEAIAEYREAIKLDPKYAIAHNNLGSALRAIGKNSEAIAEYREAIKADAKYVLAHFNLGFALRADNNNEGAIAAYREAIKLDPDYVAAHNNLGVALRAIGLTEDAIAAYREAIKLNPNYALARNNLGFVLSEIGKSEEAIAEYRTVLKIDPENATARDRLDELLEKQAKRN